MFRSPRWLVTAAASLAACSSGTEPQAPPCTAAGFPVSLAVGEYASVDQIADSGCTVFPANGSADAEYVVVAQLGTGTPGRQERFLLFGDTIRPAPVPAPLGPQLDASNLITRARTPGEQFHMFLRQAEEQRSWGFPPEQGAIETAPPLAAGPPPAMNSLRTFQVCARLDCSRFDRVVARVRAVKTKVAILIDTLAPAGGLDSSRIDSLATLFDQRLYHIDTAAFGVESDIDANTVVMVLMTNTVNKLVPKSQCATGGFVGGFFFGLDLDPRFRNDLRSNKGEVFYTIVADPAGTLSCVHTARDVALSVPVTLVHEFQHMISFNQHVLARGSPNGEVLWLNEGLSHYAEELAGRSYEAVPNAQIGPVVFAAAPPFLYYFGNLLNSYDYLDSTGTHFLLTTAGIGTLTERGAAWLFVRYLVDRYSTGNTIAQWNAFTRGLVQTANSGAANVAAVTGDPFADVVGRWALANWVSDLPGFTAPAELRYESWSLRATFASLNTQREEAFPKPYPLTPTTSDGRDVLLSGTLRAGSGVYHQAVQPGNDPGFTLQLTTAGGGLISSTLVPRLNVVRIR